MLFQRIKRGLKASVSVHELQAKFRILTTFTQLDAPEYGMSNRAQYIGLLLEQFKHVVFTNLLMGINNRLFHSQWSRYHVCNIFR